MHEYMSKTERIQSYIKEVLADEKKHSTKEIIEYVDDKLKEYFTKRGPDFIERSTVKPYEESNFIILTDNDINEEPQMEM